MTPPDEHPGEGGRDDRGVPYHAESTLSSAQVVPQVLKCNAYADAVATAYLGNNDTEDASKVVRDAVRTRPCMYTMRGEAAENTEKREIADRRTYASTWRSGFEFLEKQRLVALIALEIYIC